MEERTDLAKKRARINTAKVKGGNTEGLRGLNKWRAGRYATRNTKGVEKGGFAGALAQQRMMAGMSADKAEGAEEARMWGMAYDGNNAAVVGALAGAGSAKATGAQIRAGVNELAKTGSVGDLAKVLDNNNFNPTQKKQLGEAMLANPSIKNDASFMNDYAKELAAGNPHNFNSLQDYVQGKTVSDGRGGTRRAGYSINNTDQKYVNSMDDDGMKYLAQNGNAGTFAGGEHKLGQAATSDGVKEKTRNHIVDMTKSGRSDDNMTATQRAAFTAGVTSGVSSGGLHNLSVQNIKDMKSNAAAVSDPSTGAGPRAALQQVFNEANSTGVTRNTRVTQSQRDEWQR